MRLRPAPILLLLVAALLAACGKKGPPRAPESRGPLPPQSVEARQEGTSVIVSFVIPAARGPKPSQLLSRVELLRVEYAQDARPGADPDGFRRRGRIVAEDEALPLDPGAHRDLEDSTAGALPDGGVGLVLRYGVRLLDRRGRTSPIVVAPDLVPVAALPPPLDVRAEATSDGIRLRWTAPDAATDLLYNVYRSTAGEPPAHAPIHRDPLDSTEFLDTEVKQGVSYTYAVRTSAAGGRPYRESLPSGSVTVLAEDRAAPAAPARLVAVQEGIAIRLLWSPSEETDLAGYRVYRRKAGEEWNRIGPDVVDHPTYLDGDVRVLDRFEYRVTAVDRAKPPNESAPSEMVEATVSAEPEGSGGEAP